MPFNIQELQHLWLVFTCGIKTRPFTMKYFMRNTWDIHMTSVLYTNITKKSVVWSIFSSSPAFFIIGASGKSKDQCWTSMWTNGKSILVLLIYDWIYNPATDQSENFRPNTGTYLEPIKMGHRETWWTTYAKSSHMNLTLTPFEPVTIFTSIHATRELSCSDGTGIDVTE